MVSTGVIREALYTGERWRRKRRGCWRLSGRRGGYGYHHGMMLDADGHQIIASGR